MVYPHTYRTEHSETKTTNAMYGDYYRSEHAKKIKIQPDLLKQLQFIDSNHQLLIDDLQEAVAIKSVSGSLKYKNEVIKMVKLIEKWMVKMGARYECFYIGYHVLDGERVRLPPVILGTVKAGPGKKTVCVYGNLDVKEPVVERWSSDPWVTEERSKVIYGNGVALGKGPLIMWFHAIMAFKKSGVELPVNVKFIIESMHFQRSEGLKDFLMTQKQDFLHYIDYNVVCDSEWLGDKYPCITYGCVGIIHFCVTMTKSEKATTNLKDDMVRLFDKIADKDKVLVPNFNKDVTQITPDEEQLYEQIIFDVDQYRSNLPPEKRSWGKTKLLMHFWRMPTIFVNDIEECICEKKDDSKIKRKFIIKIVPKQNAETCITSVASFIKRVVKELGIEHTVDLESKFETRPWLEDCSSISYEAAKRATIQIYKESPNMIREDRDYMCINILKMTEKPMLLLPICPKGSNGGQDNENLTVRNLCEGTKLLAAYLYQIAYLANK